MNRLIVRTQIVGRRSLADTPIEIADAGPVQTVRDLLDAIVRSQVDAFRTRKQEARVLRILTEREIADGREAGKIALGDQIPDDRLPDPEQAIDAALTAFEDAFYFMFVNDQQMERLDHPLAAAEVTDILFVRLTPLAGG
jgi:hypothetical protein